MEKNEIQPFMNSVREAAALQDNSKLDFIMDSAKINDSISIFSITLYISTLLCYKKQHLT